MLYLLVLLITTISYFATIFFMKKMKSVKFWNFIFAGLAYISYIILVVKIFLDVGYNDWNFQNTLPFANVSPFIFSTIPIVLFAPKKIRKHLYLLISLLSVGMLLSIAVDCIHFASIGYKFHYHFLLNYLSHFLISLWGIYLIKSKQVSLNIKNSLISSSIIISVAILMIILNCIFNTTFFGLSLNGNHSIYNNIIVSNSYLSALIYFLGLITVLVLGYIFNKIINKKEK